jgi:predicted metal-binding protein
MKGYKLHIIKEYVSTALISEDPDEALQEAIMELINLAPDQQDDALDYLHHKEKQLTIRGTTYA